MHLLEHSTSRRHRRRSAVAGALLLGVLFAACGSDDPIDAEGTTARPASSTETSAPADSQSAPTSASPANTEVDAADPSASAPADTGAPQAEHEFEPPEQSKLLSPLFSGSTYALPAWIADDLGLWEKYGLEVDYPLVASTQVIPLYLSGDVKFGAIGGYTLVPIARLGEPVATYGWFTNRFAYKFFAKPEITSVADLEGRNIGISQPGGLPHAAALAVLEREGVDSGSVTFVPLGSVGNIITSLISGQVDAGAFGAPYSVTAADEGFTELADLAQEDIPFPGVAYLGDPEWVDENPNTAKAYLRGWLEAMWIIYTDDATAREILAKYLELDLVADEKLLTASLDELRLAVEPPIASSSVTSEELKDAILKAEELKGESVEGIDINQIVAERDLFQELEDEGFFSHLESTYGPLPAVGG